MHHSIFLYTVVILIAFSSIGCQKELKSGKVPNSVLLKNLLTQEDTDGDKKITVEDRGLKEFTFMDAHGISQKVKGTYHLSNLLQELAIAGENDSIQISKIIEVPTKRISRLIKTRYWDNLTRSIDKKGLAAVLEDTKSAVDTFRLYIPKKDKEAIDYFKAITIKMPKLQIVVLPENITPQFVKSINNKPGILNLDHTTSKGEYRAKPYVVPGGRFNEMYGWDSYFESIGLLIDDRTDLAMAMADNFGYQINHYGKILNANRTYYLTRTQPPFFSSLLKEIYSKDRNISKEWIAKNLEFVIKEYEDVWMKKGVRLTHNGLSRFYGEGLGIPPETEKGHFDFILNAYAKKYQMDLSGFTKKYKSGKIIDTALGLHFTHDRSMRESGHDTSNRLDNVASHLNTVGLNSLLYKYETDIAFLIKEVFAGTFQTKDKTYTSSDWVTKSEKRKKIMIQLLWNAENGSYYDYNFKTKTQQKISSATNIYPLWAGLCTTEQAARLVKRLFDDLVQKGGIAGTSDIKDTKNPEAPQRQWDYPNGWAPHQMIIWQGLIRYGYEEEAQELIYRWLWTITKNAVHYNGTIPEKYDVVKSTHKVYAEYGNVGTEFDYITPSGFGWMNASYQLGLSLIQKKYKKELDELTDPAIIFISK